MFTFILGSTCFLRQLGGEEDTRELIDHILKLSELRNVDIQIMPLSHHGAWMDLCKCWRHRTTSGWATWRTGAAGAVHAPETP
ncbi:hypothetical protein SCYAM73S_07682 [Streptomyces cyaneofuscatus]